MKIEEDENEARSDEPAHGDVEVNIEEPLQEKNEGENEEVAAAREVASVAGKRKATRSAECQMPREERTEGERAEGERRIQKPKGQATSP